VPPDVLRLALEHLLHPHPPLDDTIGMQVLRLDLALIQQPIEEPALVLGPHQ